MKELRTVSAEVAELMVLMKHPNQAFQMSTSSFKVLTKEKKFNATVVLVIKFGITYKYFN